MLVRGWAEIRAKSANVQGGRQAKQAGANDLHAGRRCSRWRCHQRVQQQQRQQAAQQLSSHPRPGPGCCEQRG